MSRFLKTVVVCTVMLFTITAHAQTPNQGGRNAKGNARKSFTIPKDTAIALLQKPVESIDWIEKTLEEIVEWLEDESEGGVNVIPRWVALGAEGVNNESVVSLKLSHTTMAEVLNEILDQLSEDGQLAYHAMDNILRISTKGDFERKLYLRVYDVTDVLFRIPNFGQESPQIDLQATTSGGGGGGGGSGQSVFSGGSSGGSQDRGGTQAQQLAIAQLNQLMMMITASIEPQSWGSILRARIGRGRSSGSSTRSNTGTGTGPGRISAYKHSLIVYNTIEVHEHIAGMFAFGK